MDEATANIEIQTDKNIQEIIRTIFNDVTVITVAHRLQTIMDADRVMVFDNGMLKEMETPYNLIQDEKSIFNGLVQQSGCSEELLKLAQKKEPSTPTTASQISNENSTSSSEKQEVVILTNDSKGPSPVQTKETVKRNQMKEKIIGTPSLDKVVSLKTR
ncbi:multidrug resistance-associated protein, putative, partial [Entamoeba invadens IP1]|uniref:multidrug resistance-associated protein, putative n=1 Tax=Entamoeba invadens IP1 TaxID=370355 RepID=UPI0002C3EED7